MATYNVVSRVSRTINILPRMISSLTANNAFNTPKTLLNERFAGILPLFFRQCHTGQNAEKLMQFFDDKKNWGEYEVKVGRSWRKEELRLKSSTDLHKLWYVLLKEKNMLLTMEHECNDRLELFPNPERIDKVNESMKNLEDVVRERNKAYHLLETGEDGERPKELVVDQLGLTRMYRKREHVMPKFMNVKHTNKFRINLRGNAVSRFLKFYRENLWNEKRKLKNREFNHVCGLLKRFPNMDMEALKQEYPNVDIEKAKRSPRSRGHFVKE